MKKTYFQKDIKFTNVMLDKLTRYFLFSFGLPPFIICQMK